MPDGDGLNTLKTIQEMGLAVPASILSARDSVEDRILGLNTGADGDMEESGVVWERFQPGAGPGKVDA